MRSVNGMRAARVATAAIFLIRTTPLANLLPTPLAHVRGPLLGWPEPGWNGAWWNLELPASIQMFACIVRTIAAVAFFTGFRTRVSGVMAGLLGLVALSQNPFGFIFTLYTLFTGTVAIALSDEPLIKRSPLRLVHALVISIYAWSAIAKLTGAWLSGDTLRALAEDDLISPWLSAQLSSHAALLTVSSYSVVAAELVIPVALSFRKTRGLALLGAVLFHLVLELAMHPDVMSGVIGALLLSFVGVDSRRRRAV